MTTANIQTLNDHQLDHVVGGFTLIELLVVIPRIEILVVLQPATGTNPHH